MCIYICNGQTEKKYKNSKDIGKDFNLQTTSGKNEKIPKNQKQTNRKKKQKRKQTTNPF